MIDGTQSIKKWCRLAPERAQTPNTKDWRFSRAVCEVLFSRISDRKAEVVEDSSEWWAIGEEEEEEEVAETQWERVPLTMQVWAGSLNSCSALWYAVVSLVIFSSAFHSENNLDWYRVPAKSAKRSVNCKLETRCMYISRIGNWSIKLLQFEKFVFKISKL